MTRSSILAESAAQPASAARAALQQLSATASPPLAAVAAIGVDRGCGQQLGSYAVHPAVLDSATHTAAVFSAANSSTAVAPAVTRIPVALEAYCAAPHQEAGRRKWCSGALEALRQDGSVVTSFSLGGGAARLSGFQAKVKCCPPHLICSEAYLLPDRP